MPQINRERRIPNRAVTTPPTSDPATVAKNPTSFDIAAISLSEKPSEMYRGVAINPAIASPTLYANTKMRIAGQIGRRVKSVNGPITAVESHCLNAFHPLSFLVLRAEREFSAALAGGPGPKRNTRKPTTSIPAIVAYAADQPAWAAMTNAPAPEHNIATL